MIESDQEIFQMMCSSEELMLLLQKKGHSCSLSIDYSVHHNDKTIEKNYMLRINDGFSVISHTTMYLGTLLNHLNEFAIKRGYIKCC